MSFFNVSIYTPSKIVNKKIMADSLLVPTVEGEINILPEHTHLIAKLDTGLLTIQNKNQKDDHFVITTGICKVLEKDVLILAGNAEHRDEIDPERAKKALDKAIAKLNGEESLQDLELIKFQRKAERAKARLAAAYTR